MKKTTTSPDIMQFCKENFISKAKNTPVYKQIAQILKNAIDLGLMLDNVFLPGSRVLAQTFNVHRNTITSALDELASEGYITIIPNKGCKINLDLKQNRTSQLNSIAEHDIGEELHQVNTKTPIKISSNPLWVTTENRSQKLRIIEQHTIPDLLPTAYFAKTYSSILKRPATAKLITQNTCETLSHLQPILQWIAKTRKIAFTEDQIIFVPNRLLALQHLLATVTQENDTIITTQLSDANINTLFQKQKCKISTINTTFQGIDIKQIKQKIARRQRIKLVYTNPNHLYPNGQIMLQQNRYDVLELAQEQQFLIVEDDYMHDVYLKHQNIINISSMDAQGNTIYISDFQAMLGAHLSVAYIIAPTNIIKALRKQVETFLPYNIYLQTRAIAEYIQEGEWDKLQKKYRKYAIQHSSECLQILKQMIGEFSTINTSNNGLVFWIAFLKPINLIQLKSNANALGLQIDASQLFQNKETCAIRWCYGHQNTEEVAQVAAILKLAHQILH